MKKTIFFLIACLSCVSSLSAFAARESKFTLNEYVEYVENKAIGKKSNRSSIDSIYLNGVANGFNVSNVFSGLINKKPLFCSPPDLTINGDLLDLTLQSFLVSEEGRKMMKEMGDMSVEVVALKSFIVVYPCK